MAVEIKKINFDTFSAIVNMVVENTFQNNVYNAELYDISLRTALLKAFAPDYEIADDLDNNALFERVYSDEAQEIITNIFNTPQGCAADRAIVDAVEFRKNGIINGGMSMSDYALSKVLDVVADKVSQIDTTVLNDDTIQAIKKAADQTNTYDFADKLIDSFAEKGYFKKPNRATRRKNKKEE